MGQVALGFRSLLFKLAVFFVLASLLAWALGGTLWPRAEVIDYAGTTVGGRTWYWQLLAGGKQRGEARWRLMSSDGSGEPEPVDERLWADVAGPVAVADAVYYGGRSDDETLWRIERVGGGTPLLVPDRLAVEQQLARLDAGLGLQDPGTIERQRPRVLEPDAGG